MRIDVRAVGLMALGLALTAGCGPTSTPPTIVERSSLKGHTREVVSIAISPDGKVLASRGADAVKVWDLGRGSEVESLPTDGADFGSLAFAPEGRMLAANRAGVGVVARDLATGDEHVYRANDAPKLGNSGLSSTRGWGVAYSPDGRALAGGGSHGGEDGFLNLWDLDAGEKVELPPLARPITTVAISPDGRTIASGSMDGKLVLWDRAARKVRVVIDAGRSYLAPVVFSPDGRLVASANEARWVKFWDPATGRDAGVLKGHVKAVLSMAFSPDGRAIVSGDSSGKLFVWEVATRRLLARLESDRGKIWGLAFTPDGKTLVSTGEDRILHLWDVSWPVPDR